MEIDLYYKNSRLEFASLIISVDLGTSFGRGEMSGALFSLWSIGFGLFDYAGMSVRVTITVLLKTESGGGDEFLIQDVAI